MIVENIYIVVRGHLDRVVKEKIFPVEIPFNAFKTLQNFSPSREEMVESNFINLPNEINFILKYGKYSFKELIKGVDYY